jgi:hypothetical protein
MKKRLNEFVIFLILYFYEGVIAKIGFFWREEKAGQFQKKQIVLEDGKKYNS